MKIKSTSEILKESFSQPFHGDRILFTGVAIIAAIESFHDTAACKLSGALVVKDKEKKFSAPSASETHNALKLAILIS